MATALSFARPDLLLETCYSCAVEFAMPRGLYDRLRRDHSNFYCPNGHAQHYVSESEAERLKRENDDLARRLQFAKNDAESERRQRIAAKGQITKLRKRIAHGVCGFCNRHFRELERHVASKHPEQASIR